MSDFEHRAVLHLILASVCLTVSSTLPAQQDNSNEGPILEVVVQQAEITVNESGKKRVIGTVRKGTRLWCFKTENEFCRVMDPGTKQKGWIWQKHVRRADKDLTPELTTLLHQTVNTKSSRERARLWEQASRGVGRELGEDHPNYAAALNKLAVLYYELGNAERSEFLFRQAMSIREKWLGTENSSYADSLNNLAAVYAQRGEAERAEPLYQQAIKIRKKVLGTAHPDYANSLNNLAALYGDLGNYARAESLYQQAMEIERKAHGHQHPRYATSLNNMANMYADQGNYESAERLHKEALEIRKKVLGEQHPHYSSSLNNLADLYICRGDYESAEVLCQQALKNRRKFLGNEHPDYATSLNNLAAIYDDLADYARAEPLYKQAITIRKKALGEQHPDTAVSINNLALLYCKMGDYGRGVPLFRQAADITNTQLGDEHPTYANCLNNLATCYTRMRDYGRAEVLYTQVLEKRKKVLGEQHLDYATSLNNLALLYDELGNHRRAEPLYQQAVEIRKNVLGEEHPSYATGINNLANLYVDLGDFARAERLYDKAIEIRRKVLGAEHPAYAVSLNNLAISQFVKGDVASATESWNRARRCVAAHVTRLLPSLPEKKQTTFLNINYQPNFFAALNAGMQAVESREASAEWLINGKAVSQSALAAQHLIMRDASDPKLAPLVRELRDTRASLASLAMSVVGPEKTRSRQLAIDQLSAKENDIAQKLTQATGTRQWRTSWVELHQVRDALPKNGALIDIVRLPKLNFQKRAGQQQWKAANYTAWITARSGDFTTVELGPADAIDELVTAVRTNLQDAAQPGGALQKDGEESATEELKIELKALADRIWFPLASHLKGVDHIALSPDGALWLTPWSALPINNEGEYLIEEYQLQYVISGRDLVQGNASAHANAPALLANPLFDQTVDDKNAAIRAIFKDVPEINPTMTRSFTAKSLLPDVAPLPNTAFEAAATQPSIEKYAAQKATLYKEGYALERVARSLQRPIVVSFATHGFFLPIQEPALDNLQRELTLAGNDMRSSAVDKDGKPIENPLLRCGLLLAGCNNRDAAIGDDDGILTGQEIVGIDFRGTELVVLSACETGVGDIRNGEGVAGLRQAFQLAGAEAVVSTLWQIPDRDSALLMQQFFAELANGSTKAEALRNAQLTRIEKRRNRTGAAHPFFWAAWTMTGAEKRSISHDNVDSQSLPGEGMARTHSNPDPATSGADTNSIGMRLRLIPTGEFMMGSPEDELGRSKIETYRKVRIEKSFYMQTTEVTQAQWKAVMQSEPWKDGRHPTSNVGESFPAVGMTWHEAIVFCSRLSEVEKNTYRLPTEEEWEYACRAGTQTAYSFGNDPAKLSEYTWRFEEAHLPGAYTTAGKKPNAFGLHDMHGNVGEWCSTSYAIESKGNKDGRSFRIVRGGSHVSIPEMLRSASRFAMPEDTATTLTGFRVVRESVPR